MDGKTLSKTLRTVFGSVIRYDANAADICFWLDGFTSEVEYVVCLVVLQHEILSTICNMPQAADGTVYEQVKGKLTLLIICISL
jgi:hypothetical protein